MAGWVVVWVDQYIMPESGSRSNMKGYGIAAWVDPWTVHRNDSGPSVDGRLDGWTGGKVDGPMDHE